MVVIESDGQGAVSCSVVALRGGEEVGHVGMPLYLAGALRPSFDAIREGRFVRPPRSTASVSYLRIESKPGDYIGQGKNETSRSTPPVHKRIKCGDFPRNSGHCDRRDGSFRG